MNSGAHDPRIVLAYAQCLARQGRHDHATQTVNSAFPQRNTDPAWADLEAWHHHHLAG